MFYACSIGDRSVNYSDQGICRTSLKSFFRSMGIIWVSMFLLKWYITFLLEEWQENELNNVLDAHGDINIAINKPPKASESFNLEHLTPWCQDVCVCVWWINILPCCTATCTHPHSSLAWRQTLLLSLNTNEHYLISQVTISWHYWRHGNLATAMCAHCPAAIKLYPMVKAILIPGLATMRLGLMTGGERYGGLNYY